MRAWKSNKTVNLLLILIALCCGLAFLPCNKIRVQNRISGGCLSESKTSYDASYVGFMGAYCCLGKWFTKTEVENFRNAILKASHSDSAKPSDLKALGITAEAIKAHEVDIKAALRESNESLADIIEKKGWSIEPDDVCESIQRPMYFPTAYHLSIEFGEMPGLKVAASQNPMGFYLPWHIECGKTRWTSYDPSIAKVVNALLPPGNQTKLTKLSSDFWTNKRSWRLLPALIFKRHARELLRTDPSWQDFDCEFEIEGIHASNLEPRMELELSPINKDCIFDEVDAALELSASGRIKRGLELCLEQHKLGLQSAKRILWLEAWQKKHKDGRLIEKLGNERISLHFLNQWKKKCLSGTPDLVFYLKERNDSGLVLANTRNNKALYFHKDPKVMYNVPEEEWMGETISLEAMFQLTP